MGLVAAAVVCAVPAQAANPPQPSAADQPARDGCQRANFGIGFDTSPEWVYVYRSPAIRKATGVVRVAHASLQDAILEHRSFDFNANLVPDPQYRFLIAGSRTLHTSNYAPGGGEERGRLHFEWESATLPVFAWPTDGDRATVWGSWIWDCGHWQSGENNTSNVTTGEHSELHPLSAIAVNRRAPYLSARGESQTDVFVSNQGDAAHAIEQCSLSHHPLTTGSYDAGFKPCATSAANRLQPLARSYHVFVPAPARPSAGARLLFRVVNRIGGGSGRQSVRKTARGLDVTVTLRGSGHQVNYGKSFFAWWSTPPRLREREERDLSPHRPDLVKVTLKSILIKRADPNPAVADPSGAHWALYLDLNGYWALLNQWAPKLTTHVTDGERIALNRTVKIYVPHRAGVWLQVAGRECDEPAGKVILGVFANLLYPCPANTDEQNPNILDVFGNDDTGTVLDTYRSVGAAVGNHVSTGVAVTQRFPGSGPIDLGNGNEGQGNYQLSYTIRRG